MALTNAQRQLGIQAVMATQDFTTIAPIPSGVPLATLLPGTTPAQVLAFLVTAIGANADAQLQTALTNLTALLNTQLAAAQATVASLQAQITAA